MVHLLEMGDLMGGEIVEHEGGARISRQEKASAPGRGAGAPAARSVLDGDGGIASPREPRNGARRRPSGRAAPASQEVGEAAGQMRDIATDAGSVGGLPGSTFTVPRLCGDMHDAMRNAAQRDHGAIGEADIVRQPAQPRCDPGRMLFREGPRRREAAARRHRQDDVALGGADPQACSGARSRPGAR